MSIQARAFEALRWTTATRLGGYLLTWSINLLVIRLLRPADYGLMALCMAWIGFFDLLSSFGQRMTLIQRATLDDAIVRKIFGGLLMWNFALFVVVQASAAWLAGFYGDETLEPMVRTMSAAVLFASTAIPATALRWREIDFQAVSLVGLVQTVSTSLIVLALALRGFGVWALVWGQVGGMIVHTVGTFWATGFRLAPDFDVRGLAAEIRFGAIIVSRGAVAYFERQIDTILIGKLLGSVPLGTYNVAGIVAKQPTRALLLPIQRVVLPTFARIQDDPEQVRRYYLRSVEALAFVFFPLVWGIGVVADDLVEVVMGERWIGAIPILQILCAFLPFRVPMRIMGATLDGLGRPEVALRQALTRAICVPIGVTIGVSFGILGATWGWTIAVLIALVINLRRGLPVVGARFAGVVRVVARTIAVAAAMALAVLAAKATVLAGADPLLRLPASVALGAIVYFTGTWLVNRELVARYARVLHTRGRSDEDA